MVRNVKRQRQTRITSNQARSPHHLWTNRLQPFLWKMQQWPNALLLKPRRRSTSARMKKRQMRRKQQGHSAPSCLHSLPHGYHITSWCWSTLSVKTVSLKLCGHWATGYVTLTAQSTPCATLCVTRPSEQHSGIYSCASGIKRRSLIFIRDRGRRFGRKTQFRANSFYVDLCLKMHSLIHIQSWNAAFLPHLSRERYWTEFGSTKLVLDLWDIYKANKSPSIRSVQVTVSWKLLAKIGLDLHSPKNIYF